MILVKGSLRGGPAVLLVGAGWKFLSIFTVICYILLFVLPQVRGLDIEKNPVSKGHKIQTNQLTIYASAL